MLLVEENNLEEIVSLLERNGAGDINAQNKTGQTALVLAARNGNLAISEYLVTKGADLNIQNKVLLLIQLRKTLMFLVWTNSIVYCMLVWILQYC